MNERKNKTEFSWIVNDVSLHVRSENEKRQKKTAKATDKRVLTIIKCAYIQTQRESSRLAFSRKRQHYQARNTPTTEYVDDVTETTRHLYQFLRAFSRRITINIFKRLKDSLTNTHQLTFIISPLWGILFYVPFFCVLFQHSVTSPLSFLLIFHFIQPLVFISNLTFCSLVFIFRILRRGNSRRTRKNKPQLSVYIFLKNVLLCVCYNSTSYKIYDTQRNVKAKEDGKKI